MADEAAARAAVGTAVQSRDAARAAMDEARDAHRALSVEIATLEEMERSSALSAGEARAWLVEHVDEVLGLCEPLSHVTRSRPASSLWWNRFWAGTWPRCSWKTRAR